MIQVKWRKRTNYSPATPAIPFFTALCNISYGGLQCVCPNKHIWLSFHTKQIYIYIYFHTELFQLTEWVVDLSFLPKEKKKSENKRLLVLLRHPCGSDRINCCFTSEFSCKLRSLWAVDNKYTQKNVAEYDFCEIWIKYLKTYLTCQSKLDFTWKHCKP